MKIIKPSVIELKQTDLFKHIELCGRTCYKSEDRITDGSAEKFVNMLREHAHGAMLEHGTVYLEIPNEDIFQANDVVKELQLITGQWVRLASIVREPLPYSKTTFSDNSVCITTNYRVIVENNIEWLMEKYQCAPTEHHYKRRTFKITCNRGVSHEFVRHRVFSFAQESQRYCNYSKDKFSNEVKFIEPTALSNIGSDKESQNYAIWYESCANAEVDYLAMIKNGATPQEARDILPNACATELIMTGFESDWGHFFDLRCAKDAHPEAQEIANMIKEQF